ncbi:MAG: hypothetical protein U0414_20575 [Polyangiaceae bacterium]
MAAPFRRGFASGPRRSARLGLSLGLASFLGACTSTTPPKVPVASHGSSKFVEAFDQNLTDPTADEPFLAAIDEAVKDPTQASNVDVVVASLDALVFQRDTDAGRTGMPIAFLTREANQRTVLRLRQAWDSLDGMKAPYVGAMRAELARALHDLALFSGEARGANVWAERRGCASRATVVAPADWAQLTGVSGVSAVEMLGALAPEYQGPSALRPRITPLVAVSDACTIDLHQVGTYSGVFDVVVDVKNPAAQDLTFLVTTTAAASLRAGGATILERKFESGATNLTVIGTAHAEEGVVRVILRVGDRGDLGPIELDVLGEDGLPLETRAPAPGDKATAKVTKPAGLVRAAPASDGDALLQATAELGLGDPRAAEHGIETYLLGRANPAERVSPSLAIAYMRAMETAGDMPDAKRVQKQKELVADILAQKPTAWEARLIQTDLTQRKKGVGDGVFEALKELGITTPTSELGSLGVLELYSVIGLAMDAGLEDVAERAYGELAKRTPNSALVARADSGLHRRTGKELVSATCGGGEDRSSTSCYGAMYSVGDRKGARAEIDRLRELRRAPYALAGSELEMLIAEGETDKALKLYDSMPPGYRSIQDILPLLAKNRAEAEARIVRDLPTAPDGVYALTKLGLIFGEPSADAKTYETIGKALVDKDREKQAMPGAATAVLKHVEHYGLDESGLLSVFTYDLRRIAGTTDVSQSGGSFGAYIEGRGSGTTLRRRIYKAKTGRVLEPDAADRSGAGGAGDLSQLEQNDYYEEISIAYYIPTEGGQLTLDTPDMLPERTAVADGELVLRLPEKLEVPIWAHKILGEPRIDRHDGYVYRRYELVGRGARSLEDGIPPLEQGVRLSLSTQTWPNIARSIKEQILALDETDPFMARFAEEAAKGDGSPAPAGVPADLFTVQKVVDHVGHTIKISNGGGMMSDMAAQYGGGSQGGTARYMIEDRQGSRAWVVYRTLKQLGIKVDLAIAETTPFSSAPDFPPHTGRFSYPLVVAHLEGGDKWIDADVEGVPLPPGRVSPELRGRSAVLSDGRIVKVEGQADAGVDTAAIDLALDAQGTAKGSIKITLRGRMAQSLNESFNTVVGSDRRELLRRTVMAWMPWADVDDVKLESAEGAWEVVINASVSVHGFGSPEGRDGHTLVLAGMDPMRSATLAQWYASRGDRESALNIESSMQYRVSRKITLAPGMTLAKQPDAVHVKGAFVEGNRSIKVDGSTITEEFDLNLPTGTVSAGDYNAFVTDVKAIDAGFLAGLRVKTGG